MARPAFRADVLGVVLSVACVIHCIALPFVAAALPALAGGWFAHQGFHILMAVLALVVGGTTFLPGFRRHRLGWIPALGLSGIAALAIGAAVPCQHDHGAHACGTSCSASATTSGCDHEACGGGAMDSGEACCTTGAGKAKSCCGGADEAALAAPGQPSSDAEVLAAAVGSAKPAPEVMVQAASIAPKDDHQHSGWRDLLHHLITPVGCACLIIAHVANRRALHRCAPGCRHG